MSSEQRTFPEEFNTLGDYVTACVKKWEPLTKGIEEEVEVEVETAKTRVSWVLEQEACYLKSLSEEERTKEIGMALKFIFPVLRRAMVKLPPGETAFVTICAHLEEAWEVIFEVAGSGSCRTEGSIEDVRHLIGPLGERIQASLQALETL